MSPGDIVLVRMPQSVGLPKLRPGLVLAILPGPFQDRPVCGISTQLHQEVTGWDEVIGTADADLASSGLRQPSLIRLSYLHAVDPAAIAGRIGTIDARRLERLRQRLSDHVRP